MDATSRTIQGGTVIMRLIDADKLIRRMRNDMDRMKYQYNLDVIEGMSLAIGYIVGSPTAYDSDKVIEKLQVLSDKADDDMLEQECIEKPVISKMDRAFLEYLGTEINYITRDMDGGLFIYISKPHKLIDCWESSGCELDKSLKSFKLDFPMVKWEDDKPWLIEDLKKLEVVDSYE